MDTQIGNTLHPSSSLIQPVVTSCFLVHVFGMIFCCLEIPVGKILGFKPLSYRNGATRARNPILQAFVCDATRSTARICSCDADSDCWCHINTGLAARLAIGTCLQRRRSLVFPSLLNTSIVVRCSLSSSFSCFLVGGRC